MRIGLRSGIVSGVASRTRGPQQRLFPRSSSSGGGGDGSGIPEKESPPTPPPPPPLEFLDVPYYEGDDACEEKHRLDVYIPSAPFPRPRSRTCLFVHGGSWQRGDRRHPAVPDQFYGNVGRAFAAKGLVGLVMSYRLAPEVQHPEQVRDVARAIRWARDNASRYGGDGDDLVLVGHSAGAHLAALSLADGRWLEEAGVLAPTPRAAPPGGGATSTSSPPSGTKPAACTAPAAAAAGGDGSTPPEPPPPPSSSRRPARVVSGFVGISGVYDIPRMAGNVVGNVLARAAFGNDRRAWHAASPVHRVRAALGIRGGGSGGGGGNDGRAGASAGRARAAAAATEGGGGGAPSAKSDGGGGGGGTRRSSCCPLLVTPVLLLTAASDFHLEDDAEALVAALSSSRGLARRTSTT
ncbi:unnamed protein product, partial [Ectocarpus sp. 12 AP-2014]